MWCVYVCVPPVCKRQRRPQRLSDLLELEVQGVVMCPTWLLEIELKSPERGADAANCCAISPAPLKTSLKVICASYLFLYNYSKNLVALDIIFCFNVTVQYFLCTTCFSHEAAASG